MDLSAYVYFFQFNVIYENCNKISARRGLFITQPSETRFMLIIVYIKPQ